MRRIILVGTCAFLVGALAGTGVANQRPTPTPLPMPQDWVPFSADVTQFNANGDKSLGRFYRASDGSTRTDLMVNYGDKVVKTIYIENFTRRMYYRNLSGRPEWAQGELQRPDGHLRAMSWSSNAEGLAPYAYKLAVLKGQDGSLAATDGLSAYIFTSAAGTVRVMAPDLNFFPVVSSPVAGVRRVHTNIEVGEQEPSLFEPLPGAILERLPARR